MSTLDNAPPESPSAWRRTVDTLSVKACIDSLQRAITNVEALAAEMAELAHRPTITDEPTTAELRQGGITSLRAIAAE